MWTSQVPKRTWPLSQKKLKSLLAMIFGTFEVQERVRSSDIRGSVGFLHAEVYSWRRGNTFCLGVLGRLKEGQRRSCS